MSLICSECYRDMRPSESLPGREGVFVKPVLMSLVYLSDKEGEYDLSYLATPAGMSLCFECIEGKLPEGRMPALKSVYEAYEAETASREIEEEQKGRWVAGKELGLKLDADKRLEKRLKTLERDCLFCDTDVENGLPFFLGNVLDKVYSEQHLTFGANYSWSENETGSTGFRMCFNDFRQHFPKLFEEFSYMLRGKPNPNLKLPPSTLNISPEFEEALERDGKSIDEWINELAKKGNVDNLMIIRRERRGKKGRES